MCVWVCACGYSCAGQHRRLNQKLRVENNCYGPWFSLVVFIRSKRKKQRTNSDEWRNLRQNTHHNSFARNTVMLRVIMMFGRSLYINCASQLTHLARRCVCVCDDCACVYEQYGILSRRLKSCTRFEYTRYSLLIT